MVYKLFILFFLLFFKKFIQILFMIKMKLSITEIEINNI